MEYFIYEGNVVYSILFGGFEEYSSRMSRCIYENGNIIKYEQGGYICDIDVEMYQYKNDRLNEVIAVYNYTPSMGGIQSKYFVQYNDKGEITGLIGGDIINEEEIDEAKRRMD